MKHIAISLKVIFILFATFVCSCTSDSKNDIFPELDDNEAWTLKMNKNSFSLEYLQRDTLLVQGVDTSQVKWQIMEGDSCITMLGNVVVGRRIGTAKIAAKTGDEFGLVTVNVTSEEYIRVDNVIFEVDGQEYIHMNGTVDYRKGMRFNNEDTCMCFPYEKVTVKIAGVEPANASCQYFAGNVPDAVNCLSYKDTSKRTGKILIEWYGGGYPNNDDIGNFTPTYPWDGFFRDHRYSKHFGYYFCSEYSGTAAQESKDGYCHEQEIFSYRLGEHFKHYSQGKSGHDYVGHRAFVYAFPPDLQKTEWDRQQLKEKLTEYEYETNIIQAHILYLTDFGPTYAFMVENDLSISLYPGESVQLKTRYIGAAEYKEWVEKKIAFVPWNWDYYEDFVFVNNAVVSVSADFVPNDEDKWQFYHDGATYVGYLYQDILLEETDEEYQKIKNSVISHPKYTGLGGGWFYGAFIDNRWIQNFAWWGDRCVCWHTWDDINVVVLNPEFEE